MRRLRATLRLRRRGHRHDRRRQDVCGRRVSRLFDELTLTHADGSYPRLLAMLAKADVLVLDDWGSRLSVLRSGATYMPDEFPLLRTPALELQLEDLR